jgi:hypothetical protein
VPPLQRIYVFRAGLYYYKLAVLGRVAICGAPSPRPASKGGARARSCRAIAEPWFLAFNAKLTVRPAMNGQDLAAAMPAIKAAVTSYSRAAK